MSTTIFVTGATGTVGKKLIVELLAAGVNVIAGVRDIEKAKALFPEGVHIREFDFERAETFESALKGAEKVFLLGPPLNTSLDSLLSPFINYLAENKILRVVYLSALGLDDVPSLPFHKDVITKLRELNFELTVLLPTFFAQNFKNYEGENILQRGIVFAPAGNGSASFVDVADIAKSATAVFLNNDTIGKEYVLTGPELFTYADVAGLVSNVLSKQIVYPNPSADEYRGALAGAGAPAFVAEYMLDVYSLIANNKAAIISSDVELLTGRKPGTLASVLEQDFGKN